MMMSAQQFWGGSDLNHRRHMQGLSSSPFVPTHHHHHHHHIGNNNNSTERRRDPALKHLSLYLLQLLYVFRSHFTQLFLALFFSYFPFENINQVIDYSSTVGPGLQRSRIACHRGRRQNPSSSYHPTPRCDCRK